MSREVETGHKFLASEILEVCDGVRDSRRPCMNWSNSLKALNRKLQLVLARLAPGNPENLGVYRGPKKSKLVLLGIPGSLREDDTESRTSVHLTREQS